MPELFSQRFHFFLPQLQPHGGRTGTLSVPGGLPWNQQRVRTEDGESPREMLRRCIQATGASLRDCQVEADLAVVAVVQWEDYTRIWRACIQAIKTEGVDIPTYYNSNARHTARYFRLDLTPRLGVAFTHPYPHIHTELTEAPRYSLNGWTSANVVIDFFEHVYIECYHRECWLDWAQRVWRRHWGRTHGHAPAAIDPFPIIVQAFADSHYGALEGLQAEIDELKRQLRREKDDAYPLRADAAKCALLAYPRG